MRHNNFRTRLTTGTFTLPILIGVTVLLWMLPDLTDLHLWLGLAVVGIITFLLEELNNTCALIRIRSRMVGTTFIALFLSCPEFHKWSTGLIPPLCLVISYFQLFATYQKARPEGNVFSGFLFLGIAGWFYPPLLFCAAILYICLLIPLRALTWRTFFAGFFGLALPFWFYTAWAIWKDQLPTAYDDFMLAFHFEATDFSAIPQGVLYWLCFNALIVICSILHFTYTAYNDKIRTRMYYYVIISVEIFILALIILQPQSYPVMSGLLITNSAPLIAHYFTLGKGKILNYWLIVCLIIWTVISVFNIFDLWMLL